jgi:hypothetical protein
MRLVFVCFLFLFLTLSAGAQPRADEYIDVVFLRGGNMVEGTLIAYEFGEEVTIVTEAGGTKTYGWDEIRRVNFQLDKRRLEEIRADLRKEQVMDAKEREEEEVPEKFTRKFLHQVSGFLALGENSNGSNNNQNVTTIGGGVAYHLHRPLGWMKVGLGVDVTMMSHFRRENILALTGQLELPLSRRAKSITPFLRAEVGPAIPFGTPGGEEEISERNLSVLLHPSLGVFFAPREGKTGGITLDLGYRFLDASFTITNASLDVIERTVNYRRLCLRGG